MLELNDEMGEADPQPVSEASDWIERVTDATNDFEYVGVEVAAGLGL